jgi:3-oxoacyl-[acyl-carrier-protein] synthase II
MGLAITGIGILAGFGQTLDDLYNTMYTGCNRFTVDIPPIKEKGLAFADSITKKAYFAMKSAAEDSGTVCENREDMGIFIGSAFSSLSSIASFEQKSIEKGMRAVMPMDFMNTVMNAPAGQLAIRSKLSGMNITHSDGSAASVCALGTCADMLDEKRVKAAVIGGIEEMSDIYSDYMELNGAKPSEGYCIFIAENADDARKRGAHIYAELLGSAYKYKKDFSEKDVLSLMSEAANGAGVSLTDVDFTVISGGEAAKAAIEKTDVKNININEIIGDTYGAWGAFAAATAAAIFEKGALPDGYRIPEKSLAVTGCFGFDGFMGCCVLKGGRNNE